MRSGWRQTALLALCLSLVLPASGGFSNSQTANAQPLAGEYGLPRELLLGEPDLTTGLSPEEAIRVFDLVDLLNYKIAVLEADTATCRSLYEARIAAWKTMYEEERASKRRLYWTAAGVVGALAVSLWIGASIGG